MANALSKGVAMQILWYFPSGRMMACCFSKRRCVALVVQNAMQYLFKGGACQPVRIYWSNPTVQLTHLPVQERAVSVKTVNCASKPSISPTYNSFQDFFMTVQILLIEHFFHKSVFLVASPLFFASSQKFIAIFCCFSDFLLWKGCKLSSPYFSTR